MEKIVVLAIPVYLASLLLEAWYSSYKSKNLYNLKDSFGNLGTGIMMQLLEVFTKAPLIALYLFLSEKINIPQFFGINLWSEDISTAHGIVSWISIFLLVDFVYYLFHRHSHEINLLWAAHIVHHSSEEYNFSVALRQSTFQGLFFFVYLSTIALTGAPALMVLACYGINLIYQFFLHTRLIGKLGVLESIFNTPSHHRVHHARQEKYLDRNYAGVFIIWDKMCGTFIEEKEEPKYGIYPRFQSYDPVRANLMPIMELFHYFQIAKGPDKFKVLFSGPLWIFEKFKKGKKLNILASATTTSLFDIGLFAAALICALLVLFIPQLNLLTKLVIVIMAIALLKAMGSRLDKIN